MGLPFDWHLRPRQVSRMPSTLRAPPSSGRSASLGALSLLRPSMQQLRQFSRRHLQLRVRAGPLMYWEFLALHDAHVS